MKSHALSMALLIAFSSGSAVAQSLYKWTDKDGKVNYTDTPPPAFAKQSEIKAASGGGTDTRNLPYELAQAAKNSPVILYTGADCAPCGSGRSLLTARGIPFTEKTVRTVEDGLQFKQAGGTGTLPLLIVGRSQQTGFEANDWGKILSAAGYPDTSKLPPGFRNTAAVPAAPAMIKNAASVKKNTEAAALPVPANTPVSGFRF